MTVGMGPQPVKSMSVSTVMLTMPVLMVMIRGGSITVSCVRIGILCLAGVDDGGILSGQSAATWPYSSHQNILCRGSGMPHVPIPDTESTCHHQLT